ncbi:MAG: hypothetical protein K1X79_05590 [Oligoflexia bacterium]|nr:hypothetical protein [Oligoflexia bacterium]
MQEETGLSLLELIITSSLVLLCTAYTATQLSGRPDIMALAKHVERFLQTNWVRAISDEEDISISLSPNMITRFGPHGEQEQLTFPRRIRLLSSHSKINFYASGVASPASFDLALGQTRCKFAIALRGRIRHVCT